MTTNDELHKADELLEPTQFGAIENLLDLISVQPQSTVSRTILSQPESKLVLFAFDAGQELSEHTASVSVFVQVLQGALEVRCSDSNVLVRQGGMTYIHARAPHAVRAVEPTIMLLTMLTAKAESYIKRKCQLA